MNVLLWTLTILSSASVIHGYNILVLMPFNGPSHWLFMERFLDKLIERGHSVTCITSQPAKYLKSTNYTEVLIDPPLDLSQFLPADDLYQRTHPSDLTNIRMYTTVAREASYHGLKHPKVQEIVRSRNLHFDLIINEEFFQQSFLMFAYKFNAPIVTISTYGHSDFFDRAMGLLTPWSHVPHMVLSYTDDMSFLQRFYNAFLSIYDWCHRNWFVLPQHNEDAKEFFGYLEEERRRPLPTVEELERNISMILVNSHRSVAPPRPLMPGIVNIGGAHIQPPKPLPSDIQKIMDDAKHGVIYFSLGSFVQSNQMPKEKIATFLEVFGKLKQTVFWKFEGESPPNVPPNVFLRKWMPQSDILAHKNIVLFITHGGMFGTSEAVHRGAPMLFLPLFGDQYRNAERAQMNGYGRVLRFSDVNNENLLELVTEMTSNKKYLSKAKELSSIMRDNLVHPMDEALFWIEYVVRHKGAKHLKSHAVNMSWFSYLLLDVSGFIVISFAVAIFVTSSILAVLCKKRSSRFDDKKKHK